MRLIDDFAQRLDAGTLPERFTDWWIVEDADREFLEHPFDKVYDHDWMAITDFGWVWENFYEENDKLCGFGRIKTRTKKQQVWFDKWKQQFPENLIYQLRDLFWRQKRIDKEIAELPARIAELEKEVADKKEFIARMKERIKPGMSDAQIKGAFPRLELIDGDDDEYSFVWD